MLTLSDIFRQEGNDLVEALQRSYADKGVNASGQLSKTTEARVSKKPTFTSLEIEINKYGTLLESGRGPSKKRGGNLFAAIRQWVDDKGLIPSKGTKDNLAWAITKKIHKQGTKAFPNKGPKVLSSVITDQRVNNIIDKATDAVQAEVITDLEEIIKLRYARN